MWGWIKALDRILRGEKTRVELLRTGTIDIPVAGLAVVLVLLAAFYGTCMGTFAMLREAYLQVLASSVKLPLLFLLTLVVTFPSLYVFNALVGSRLSVLALLKLLVASLGVTLAMLAAFGTIIAFFSISTKSYSFMVLLNVLLCGVAGFLGLMFLLQTLNRLSLIERETKSMPEGRTPPGNAAPEGASGGALEIQEHYPAGALDRLPGHVLGRHVKTVFRCWVIVFGLVGAQMGWVLRPFIGDPNLPFQWFRERDSSFFQSIWGAIQDVLT